MATLSDMEWTDEQLTRLLNLLDVWGPISDKYAQMTSKELAEQVVEKLWADISVTSEESALVEEIAERLLIQGEFVRGNQTAAIPEEWEQRRDTRT